MPIEAFQFPLIMEILATIAWAVSGAIVARARGFDFMGVFVIAVIASTGGGMLRDGLFLQRTPVMLITPLYLIIAFLAMIVISLFGGLWARLPWWNRLVNVIDAFGTPAFTLLGFQLSLLAGIPFTGALFVGLINGVAGGILRDVLVGDVPQLFRPGQFNGTIAILATLIYYVLLMRVAIPISSDAAAWSALIFAAALRLLFIRRNWRSTPVSDWRMELTLARLPQEMVALYRKGMDEDDGTEG
jgi:uncharacterized membrane protein YeiH